RAVAFLPLLLVAGAAERGVERAEARERRAADGHVRAPRKTRGGIVLALVERRDRRLLAPAAVGGGTLEAGGDATGEHVGLRMLGGRAQERGEPAVANAHVVVEEDHERTGAPGEARVAGGVQAAPLVDDVAGAVALGERPCLGRGRGVV